MYLRLENTPQGRLRLTWSDWMSKEYNAGSDSWNVLAKLWHSWGSSPQALSAPIKSRLGTQLLIVWVNGDADLCGLKYEGETVK